MRLQKPYMLLFICALCFLPTLVLGQEEAKVPKASSAPNVTIPTNQKVQKATSNPQPNKNNEAGPKDESKKSRHEPPKSESNILAKSIKILNEYSSLLSAAAAFFAAIIALYLGDWKSKLEKPRLKLTFNETKKYPFFQTLAFETFGVPVDINGQVTDISRPGFNARVMIENKGKKTAKHVEAKIEKIEFYRNNRKISSTRHYHPTTVKWSGEKDWAPVDIVPDSHFFLDLFWAKNEKTSEILSFNEFRFNSYGIELKRELLKDIIDNDISPTQEIYWNVWVDNSYDRGLPRRYNIQGEIYIYFVVNADNCSPLRFKAIIEWTHDSWNSPNIKIQN